MTSDDFFIWTVYDRPRDYPKLFVARKFSTRRGPRPTSEIMFASTLDGLREMLAAMGLTRLARSPGDDPVIVETWI